MSGLAFFKQFQQQYKQDGETASITSTPFAGGMVDIADHLALLNALTHMIQKTLCKEDHSLKPLLRYQRLLGKIRVYPPHKSPSCLISMIPLNRFVDIVVHLTTTVRLASF